MARQGVGDGTMVRRDIAGLIGCALGPIWLSLGCASVPTNHARLIGSVALDVVGTYPQVIAFERGTFTSRGDEGSVILTGPRAVMLFDYQGHDNRFELLLSEAGQSILYRRLEQRPVMVGDGRKIDRPAGVSARRRGDRLEGTFDVLLERDDLRGFGPAFEHYPKQLRLVGSVAAYQSLEPVGPTTQPVAFWEPPVTHLSGAGPSGLGEVGEDWLRTRFASDLPGLPKVRRTLGVPTSLTGGR